MGHNAEPKLYNYNGKWLTRREIENMIDSGKLKPVARVHDEVIYGQVYDGTLLYVFKRGICKASRGRIKYNGCSHNERDIVWIK